MRFIVSLAVREDHGPAHIRQFGVNGNSPAEAYERACAWCESQGLQYAMDKLGWTRAMVDSPVRNPIVLIDGSEATF